MTPTETLINTTGEWLLTFTGIAIMAAGNYVVGSVALVYALVFGLGRLKMMQEKTDV